MKAFFDLFSTQPQVPVPAVTSTKVPAKPVKPFDPLCDTLEKEQVLQARKQAQRVIGKNASVRFSSVDPKSYHRFVQPKVELIKAIAASSPKDPQPLVFLDFDLTMSLRGMPKPSFHRVQPIGVTNAFVEEFIATNKDPFAVIISLANAYNPGGYPYTHAAQEEGFAHTGDLLYRIPGTYPEEAGLHAFGHTYLARGVTQYKLNEARQLVANGISSQIAFSAAPDFTQLGLAKNVETHDGRVHYIAYMTHMVRLQCEFALMTGGKLVPGALGCGAFLNNPLLVAAIYNAVLNEDKYKDIKTEFVIKYTHRPDATTRVDLPAIFNYVFESCPDVTLELLKAAPAYDARVSRSVMENDQQIETYLQKIGVKSRKSPIQPVACDAASASFSAPVVSAEDPSVLMAKEIQSRVGDDHEQGKYLPITTHPFHGPIVFGRSKSSGHKIISSNFYQIVLSKDGGLLIRDKRKNHSEVEDRETRTKIVQTYLTALSQPSFASSAKTFSAPVPFSPESQPLHAKTPLGLFSSKAQEDDNRLPSKVADHKKSLLGALARNTGVDMNTGSESSASSGMRSRRRQF